MTSTICRSAWALGQGFLPKEWDTENLQLSLEVPSPMSCPAGSGPGIKDYGVGSRCVSHPGDSPNSVLLLSIPLPRWPLSRQTIDHCLHAKRASQVLQMSPLGVYDTEKCNHNPQKCHPTSCVTQASDSWGAGMTRARDTPRSTLLLRHSSSSTQMRGTTQTLSGSWCKWAFLMRAGICITFHMW